MNNKKKWILGAMLTIVPVASISTIIVQQSKTQNNENSSSNTYNYKQEILTGIDQNNLEILKLNNEKAEIEQKLKSALEALDDSVALQRELEKANSKIRDLENDNFQLILKVNNAFDTVTSLSEEKRELQSSLNSIKLDVQRLKEENESIAILSSQLDIADKKIEDLNKNIDSKDDEISKNKAEITILKQQVEDSTEANTNITNDLMNKNQEIIDKNNIIADLENDKNELNKEIQKIENEKEALTLSNSDLVKKAQELSEAKRKIVDLELNVKAKQDFIDKQNKEMQDLQDTLSQNISENAIIRQELEQKNKDLEELREEIAILESNVRSLEQDITKKDNEIASIKILNTNLENKLQEFIVKYSSDILPDYYILNMDSDAYIQKIKSLNLDINLNEIDSASIDSRKLLENLSVTFNYKNLIKAVSNNKNLKIDLDSIKFANWELNDRYELNNTNSLNSLLLNQAKNDSEMIEKISLRFDVIDKSTGEDSRKTINYAFNVLQKLNGLEEEWKALFNSMVDKEGTRIKQGDQYLPYFLIDTDRYDSEIETLNNKDSREILVELFNSDLNIPAYYDITHKIIKRGSSSYEESKIDKINPDEKFDKSGYIIHFHVQVKSRDGKQTLLNTYSGVQIGLKSNEFTQDINGNSLNTILDIKESTYGNQEMYANILASKIDNLNEQIGINDNMSDQEKRQAHLFVSKYAEMMIYEKVGSGLHNVKYSEALPLLKYIFSDFDKDDIYKLSEEIGYRSNLDFIRKNNADKGFINSDIEKSFDFKLFDKDIWVDSNNTDKMKVDIIVDYSDIEYTFNNDYKFNLYNTLGKITIKFKHDSGISKELSFYYADSIYQNDKDQIDYEILNDLLENTNPNVVSYNTRENAVLINTTRDLFNEYVEATKKLLEKQNWSTQYELIKVMKKITGSDSLKNLHEYYNNNLMFYNKNKALQEIKSQLDWIQRSPSKEYETLFAGGTNNINDFGFHIKWNIV